MDENPQETERILKNLLEVCLYSGTRNMGIAKVMQKNRNFLGILLGKDEWNRWNRHRPPPCECFPWMETIIQANDLFFESLLAALRPSFPDGVMQSWLRITPWRGRYYADEIMWSKEWVRRHQDERAGQESLDSCHFRVMSLAIPWLAARLDDNRRLMEFLLHYPGALSPGPASWLEDFDFFFMDCWEVLEMEEFYRSRQLQLQPDFRPWPQIRPGDRQRHHEAWMESNRPLKKVYLQAEFPSAFCLLAL